MICKQCGTINTTSATLPGSGWIELVLWLFAIVPGMVYSIWRRSKHTAGRCTACGSRELVGETSPVGRTLMREYHPNGAPRLVAPPPSTASLVIHRLTVGLLMLLGGVFVVGVTIIYVVT